MMMMTAAIVKTCLLNSHNVLALVSAPYMSWIFNECVSISG